MKKTNGEFESFNSFLLNGLIIFMVSTLMLVVLVLPYKNYDNAYAKKEIPEISKMSSVPIPPVIPKWKNKYKNTSKILDCFIKNVYHEGPRYYKGLENKFEISRHELEKEIILERIRIVNVMNNRVKNSNYPNDLCSVVYQYKQFSWTLEKSKKNMNLRIINNPWEKYNIEQIRILSKLWLVYGFKDITSGSLFYHTTWSSPRWRHAYNMTETSLWHHFYAKEEV